MTDVPGVAVQLSLFLTSTTVVVSLVAYFVRVAVRLVS